MQSLAKKKSAEASKTQKKQQARQDTKAHKKQSPIRDIQKHTDTEFRRSFRTICTALLEKAECGSLAEIRLLLQIGQSGSRKQATRREDRSLGAILLDELKRRQDIRVGADEPQQSEPATDEGATGDDKTEGA